MIYSLQTQPDSHLFKTHFLKCILKLPEDSSFSSSFSQGFDTMAATCRSSKTNYLSEQYAISLIPLVLNIITTQ